MQQNNFGGLAPRLVALFSLAFLVGTDLANAFGRKSDFASVASAFSRAAGKQGRRRIAVLPFRDTSGAASRAGAVVSERLIAHLLEKGGVEVVERSQLESVMEELRLASIGIVDSGSVKKLGRFLGVDAVITGTTVELIGNQIEVHARLIDVESAKVLAASTARMEKDWSDFENTGSWSVSAPPVPFFPGDRRTVDWHDSLNSQPAPACDTNDVGEMESRAKYWALRLREPGFSAAQLKANPGSEISDPKLRERFYSLVRMWYEEEKIPPLNELEKNLLARCH